MLVGDDLNQPLSESSSPTAHKLARFAFRPAVERDLCTRSVRPASPAPDHLPVNVRPRPQIVAFGGGGFSMEPGNPLLDDYVLGLARSPRPKVCFLPTASGDADHYVVRFYRTFCENACEASHVSLFRREAGVADVERHL